jgi:hypothetical protein
MGFIGRWLSDALRLGCALLVAVLTMQVPAVTRDYAQGLLQVTDESRRDISQREDAARQYYHLQAGDDAGVIAALRPVEPSNAAGLETSVARAEVLRAAYARIAAAPPLLQPLAAGFDALTRPSPDKSAILQTVLDGYVPQVLLTQDSAIYGMAGVLLGSFVAHMLITPFLRWGRRREVRV